MKSLVLLSFLFAVPAFAQEPVVGEAVKAVEDGNKEVGQFGKAACADCAQKKTKKDANGQNIPLFKQEGPLEFTIQGDFPGVNRSNAPQNAPKPGKLTYTNLKGEKVSLDINLEARGGGRAWWCNFAPMKLRLPKGDALKGTIFERSHPGLKLVTQCESTQFQAENGDWDSVVTTEYLLYKILEASGLPYLGTRLVKATYLDNEGKKFKEGRLLVLEDSEDLAQRMEMVETGSMEDAKAKVPFALSLRMIASEADHTFGSEKNTVQLKQKEGEVKGFQVPYDFVLEPSLFPYSVRDQHHPQGWVKQQGWEKSYPDEVKKWIGVLKANKNKVMTVFDRLPYKNRPEINEQIKRWLTEFYADIESYN